MKEKIIEKQASCYHCGEDCGHQPIILNDKSFCCTGCKMVYEILNKEGLCEYYELSNNPGINRRTTVTKNKYAFLDDEKIKQSLISYSNEVQTHVTFYLPQIHCSSCLWLLENLHRLNDDIVTSKINFTLKEADIVFNHQQTSLRKVAELLTAIGYEPYISFKDLDKIKPRTDKSKIYKMGVAGFSFLNIMLLSFPEYLGIDISENNLIQLFRYLNLFLSLPVFFYSASEFYISALKSLRHKYLNIDVPIVLAIIVTFGRSVYEVLSAKGGGYFDSMTGIVLFMLIGRILQDKTYQQLSFDRDYKSYFPIAVTRINKEAEETVTLSDIALNDTLLIHHEELIPADGILTRGIGLIDYSFVTGESQPVKKEMGEIVYAGGKQIGRNIEILVIKEVAQSYLTKLWNKNENTTKEKEEKHSFVNVIARNFTWIIFGIALLCAAYWAFHNPNKIWNSVTAVLIIACPCALFLSNTFTNGNILRILGRNKFYLRNAETIEEIAKIDHIVFDKTGTLTTGNYQDIKFIGNPLTDDLKRKVATLASQSSHPMSKAIVRYLGIKTHDKIIGYTESVGYGIEGIVENDLLSLGSRKYILGDNNEQNETAVYISVEEKYVGKFVFRNHYRNRVLDLITQLRKVYPLSLLSGDNAGEKDFLQQTFGDDSKILFHQSPHDKLDAIVHIQQQGKKVMMIGDGLNDAGALQQAEVGIAVCDSSNHFTPASDAIIEANQLYRLISFIKLCKINKQVVTASFIVSILYNVIGIFYAVQGNLLPMIAAILMPASSLSILLITFGTSNYFAKKLTLI